jgi:glycosyltransferase involved in cell wall biosynthesis
MKILFVASLHHQEGRLPSAFVADRTDPLFPTSQMHRFWVKSLRALGHECAVFWRSTGAGWFGRARALRMTSRLTPLRALNALAAARPRANPILRRRNRLLLQAASRYEPDVVVLTGGNDVVLPGTLEAIRSRHGARIVYASGTSPVVFARPIERDAAPLYDLVLVNDHSHGVQWRELGAPRAEVLPLAAIDREFHHPRRDDGDDGRVAFVGTLIPERLYSERIDALTALADGPLDVWSVHAVPPRLTAAHRGAALGAGMVEILRHAAIAVNPHGNFMRYGGNMRLFEACGVGTLQIADDRPAVREWFVPGAHLLTYCTPAELRELTDAYLRDPSARRRIAESGCAHVHAHHTYDHRMRRLVDLLKSAGEVRPGEGRTNAGRRA